MSRARHGRRDPGWTRRVSLRRVLPVATPVADRRVLHRLPARQVRTGAPAREHDPGDTHPVDDPGRPAPERPAPALSRARDIDHQRTWRRCRGALRRPRGCPSSGRPGPCRDRQPAEPAGEQLENAAAAHGELRRGRHRAREQPAPGAAVHNGGEQHSDGHSHPGYEPPEHPPSAAGVSRAAPAGDGSARRGRRRQSAGAAEPERLRSSARCFAEEPRPVLARGAAGSHVAGSGVDHRQGRRASCGPDGPAPESVRAADSRARTEPRDRVARPRRSQPRGRGRLAKPRRQGLHRPRGVAPVRLQPDARDQHIRSVWPPARRRLVRRPEVLAVRDAGDDRAEPQAVRAELPAVLRLAGPQPARRQRNRSVEPACVRS